MPAEGGLLPALSSVSPHASTSRVNREGQNAARRDSVPIRDTELVSPTPVMLLSGLPAWPSDGAPSL